MAKIKLPPTNMVVLKPSRRKPVVGDVFVVNMANRRWIVGRVVCTDAMPEFGGWNLVYFYREPVASPSDIRLPMRPDLLVPPHITNDLPWRYGYFQNITNMPIAKSELLLRHIFRDDLGWSSTGYVDEFGRETPPPLVDDNHNIETYGLSGFRFIGEVLSKAIGLPPAPVETEDKDEGGVLSFSDAVKGGGKECCVSVYVPLGDAASVEDVIALVTAGVDGDDDVEVEGHGVDLQRNLLDVRFVGKSRARVLKKVRAVMAVAKEQLPAGWYVTVRGEFDEPEQRVALW
jgi:Immunity protein 26